MTMLSHTPSLAEPSRARRLKVATNDTHERLDRRIMAAKPFQDRHRYVLFLCVQYLFHRDIDALYRQTALKAVLPDLETRGRLADIRQDLIDLNQAEPGADRGPAFDSGAIDLPAALGWLYVAEGSNLGAALLIKAVAALGLDGTFGARHLSGHPDGRAQHWRSFTTALDAINLSLEEEAQVVLGAKAAFARVRGLVETFLV